MKKTGLPSVVSSFNDGLFADLWRVVDNGGKTGRFTFLYNVMKVPFSVCERVGGMFRKNE